MAIFIASLFVLVLVGVPAALILALVARGFRKGRIGPYLDTQEIQNDAPFRWVLRGTGEPRTVWVRVAISSPGKQKNLPALIGIWGELRGPAWTKSFSAGAHAPPGASLWVTNVVRDYQSGILSGSIRMADLPARPAGEEEVIEGRVTMHSPPVSLSVYATRLAPSL